MARCINPTLAQGNRDIIYSVKQKCDPKTVGGPVSYIEELDRMTMTNKKPGKALKSVLWLAV
jgi:hypothetical protein